MDQVNLEDLDERLRSRVAAATGNAETRSIRRAADGYVVDARSGDRIVHLSLALRPDGSVFEEGDTFLVEAVRAVSPGDERGQMEIDVGDPPRTVTVAASVAATLAAVEGGADAQFDRLVARINSQMFVVTAAAAGVRAGCLVGFVTQASIDPPRMLVCLSTANRTYHVAERASHLVVHFLHEGNADLAGLFGEETGDDTDKFTRCSWRPGPDGTPIVHGTNGWVSIRVVARHVLGDHVAFVGDVTDAEQEAFRPGLGFQRVHHLEAGHGA